MERSTFQTDVVVEGRSVNFKKKSHHLEHGAIIRLAYITSLIWRAQVKRCASQLENHCRHCLSSMMILHQTVAELYDSMRARRV